MDKFGFLELLKPFIAVLFLTVDGFTTGSSNLIFFESLFSAVTLVIFNFFVP